MWGGSNVEKRVRRRVCVWGGGGESKVPKNGVNIMFDFE